ncbi:MAG: D-alanine--D-alanine ligase, partial [Boseongicola sp.]|nr:D-alanine--D-alanine ligase [Boseongicola sp.]
MSSRTLPRVAAIMGGRSVEREVSLSSGQECVAALREMAYDVTAIDAGQDVLERLT